VRPAYQRSPCTVDTAIARAVWSACVTEIGALKPGNVSVYADGHGMRAEHFIRSARCAASVLGASELSVGERILRCVERTRDAVGCNTNLGIVLLAAPLTAAALRPGSTTLRELLSQVLADLDIADARLAFEAICLASPGGLGESARYDVRHTPDVTLLQAMAEAQDRDRIAFQYVSAYEDVFGIGVPSFEHALVRWRSEEWAAVAAYLAFLAAFRDTHIERKFGIETAEEVRRRAARVARQFERCYRPEEAISLLMEFDTQLKEAGINPGTSADLTVATLLVPRLEAVVEAKAG
jgi:triphosphoribosyl-dephospho-CoA synthase